MLLLFWFAFWRLLHTPETEALLLTITLTILLQLKLLLNYSEMVRRILLNLQSLEDNPLISQFSNSTNRRLTYFVGGIVTWTVVSFSFLKHIESPTARLALIAIFPLFLILYSPTLQLIQYWEVSKSGDVVNPSPLKFVSLFAPVSILSLFSSVSPCAGTAASIFRANALYLIPGTLCAILLYILARKSARKLVAKYAVE